MTWNGRVKEAEAEAKDEEESISNQVISKTVHDDAGGRTYLLNHLIKRHDLCAVGYEIRPLRMRRRTLAIFLNDSCVLSLILILTLTLGLILGVAYAPT